MRYIYLLLTSITILSCSSENNEGIEQEMLEEQVNKDTLALLATFNGQQQVNIQTFEINPKQKQEIKGEQGTIIFIPANCFGKEYDKIKIELIECYSIQDMLFNNLSTQTLGSEMLESDGMIYLNVFGAKGDTLQIKQDKIKIQMPTNQNKEGIHVFEGEKKDNSIVWSLSNEKLMFEGFYTEVVSEENKNESPPPVVEILSDVPEDSIFQIHTIKQSQPKTKVLVPDKNDGIIYNTFEVAKMGWINCDRFIEGETDDLFVSVNESQENVSLFLILNESNTCVTPDWLMMDGKIRFRNISSNESFTLVALATKVNEIHFGMTNYSSNDKTIDCPELKSVTRQELTDMLLEKFGKDIWHRPLV